MLGTVDFEHAFYLAIEVAGAARAGASFGSQNPNDTTGIQTSAQNAGQGVLLSDPVVYGRAQLCL